MMPRKDLCIHSLYFFYRIVSLLLLLSFFNRNFLLLSDQALSEENSYHTDFFHIEKNNKADTGENICVNPAALTRRYDGELLAKTGSSRAGCENYLENGDIWHSSHYPKEISVATLQRIPLILRRPAISVRATGTESAGTQRKFSLEIGEDNMAPTTIIQLPKVREAFASEEQNKITDGQSEATSVVVATNCSEQNKDCAKSISVPFVNLTLRPIAPQSCCAPIIVEATEPAPSPLWTFGWQCMMHCDQSLRNFIGSTTRRAFRIPHELVFNSAMHYKEQQPDAREYVFFLACTLSKRDQFITRATQSVALYFEPDSPSIVAASYNNQIQISYDTKRLETSFTVSACPFYDLTTEWSILSPDDTQSAKDLLFPAEVTGSGSYLLVVDASKMVKGTRYDVTVKAYHDQFPSRVGVLTLVINVDAPPFPLPVLKISKNPSPCGKFVMDASKSISNVADSALSINWSCLDGKPAKLHEYIQARSSKPLIEVPPSVMLATVIDEKAKDPLSSAIRSQLILEVENVYKQANSTQIAFSIPTQLDPPVLRAVTSDTFTIQRREEVTLEYEIVRTCSKAVLEYRWTVKCNKDNRTIDELVTFTNERKGTIKAFTLLPSAVYDFTAMVSYQVDPQSRATQRLRVNLLESTEPPPTVVLKAPAVFELCTPVTFDARGSTSHVSVKTLTVEWSCTNCPAIVESKLKSATSMLVDFSEQEVYGAIRSEAMSDHTLDEVKMTITVKLTDMNLKSSTSSTEMKIRYRPAPSAVAVEGSVQIVSISDKTKLRASFTKCNLANVAYRWSYTTRFPIKRIDELISIDTNDGATAYIKPMILLRGEVYIFELSAYYTDFPLYSTTVQFKVETLTEGLRAPDVELRPSQGSASACQAFEFKGSFETYTSDNVAYKFWFCKDFCPQFFVDFLEKQNGDDLTISEGLTYKLAKEYKQLHPSTSTLEIPVTVIFLVIDSELTYGTAEGTYKQKLEIPAPAVYAIPPLSYNIYNTESVTMQVISTCCSSADDLIIDWTVKSGFDPRPTTDLLTLSTDRLTGTIRPDVLLRGLVYITTVEIYYQHASNNVNVATAVFDITVAQGSQPARPVAVAEGPAGVQSACAVIKLRGDKSHAFTTDMGLTAVWSCVGFCPTAYANALKSASTLNIAIDAGAVYNGMSEYRKRNPNAATFEVEFRLTVTDSFGAESDDTVTVTVKNSLDVPLLAAQTPTSINLNVEDPLTLRVTATACPYVATSDSSGTVVSWTSTSADFSSFETLFSLSSDQLTATSEPNTLKSGVNYTVQVTYAYVEDEQLQAAVSFAISVSPASFFISFNLQELEFT